MIRSRDGIFFEDSALHVVLSESPQTRTHLEMVLAKQAEELAGTLVKYGHPTLVSKKSEYIRHKSVGRKQMLPSMTKGVGKQAGLLKDKNDVINSIAPPREFIDGGQAWIQYVSQEPTTRQDVVALQKRFDHQLRLQHARETGICPIRANLYSQAFDELIRQESVRCTERGLMLLHVRDELGLRITSLETAYESSVAYGFRKIITAEEEKDNMAIKIEDLENENIQLQDELNRLSQKLENTEKSYNDQRDQEEEARKREIEQLSQEAEDHTNSITKWFDENLKAEGK